MSTAPLLTAADVAERLQLGRSTVYRLVADGDLAALHIGRAVRFEPEEVEAFIARKRTKVPALQVINQDAVASSMA